jgi:boron transporter
VYLQYGIQVLTRQLKQIDSPQSENAVLVSIILAIIMLVVSFLFQSLSCKTLFHRHVRRFFADYGMPISLIATSGMAYWGRFNATNPLTLPISGAFQAAAGRSWLVKFWELDARWVGIALPFGLILWILFFFDHNVSVSNKHDCLC